MKAFASFVLLSVIIISCAPTQQSASETSSAAWYASAPLASESDSTIYAIGVATASDSAFAVFQSEEFAKAMIARYARTHLNARYSDADPTIDDVVSMNEQIQKLKIDLSPKRVEVKSEANIFTAYTEMELAKSTLE